MSVTRFMINEAEQLFSTTAACLRIACESTPLKLVALGFDCAGKSLGSFVNVKFGEKGNAGDGAANGVAMIELVVPPSVSPAAARFEGERNFGEKLDGWMRDVFAEPWI